MNFIKTDDTTIINKYRKELYQQFSTAIDGMWEVVYIASSQAYLIKNKNQNIGYCCINIEGSLTQVFLCEGHNYLMDKVIQSLIESKLISSAKLSSIDPISFNTCLAYSKSVDVNTYCFQYSNQQKVDQELLKMALVSQEEINTIQKFFKDQVAFDDNFGYTENLVQRKELYVFKDSNQIIATGECRLSDSQVEFADIGVIVNRDFQKKGLGTKVLRCMTQKAQEANRQPICSTTFDNIASKRAIEKAGFFCSHIIFDINFFDLKN